MMAMREKDQADFDLETFVDLFDTAISSDNPTVQRALKNLILVSSIVNAQENSEGLRKGPLRRLVEDMQALHKRIGNLESQGAFRSTYAPTVTNTGTASPAPGQYHTTFTNYPQVHPGTLPPGTIISGQSAGDTFSAKAFNQIDVKVGSLLEKLENK